MVPAGAHLGVGDLEAPRCIQFPVTRTAGTSAAVLLVTYLEMSSTGVSPANAQILVRLVSEVPLFESTSCEVM